VTIQQKYNFSDALRMVKAGNRIQREGWDRKGKWLLMQFPEINSDMTLPYIYMSTSNSNQVPWLCSQTDMLAEDWQLALI
jgi:uncharacterized protein with NAD-binding domain and iron-sulfur cluster